MTSDPKNGSSLVTHPNEWRDRILQRKSELNAVLLAHYYQEPDIQDLADFVGDSLELSRKAAQTDADVIVFCGVHFMAETAKILNPDKQVLLPDLDAGCSLAESAPPDLFRKFRLLHPHHLAITYINCTAEVKALSDIICTSSSAENILARIPPDIPVLFSPDRNLGKYLQKETGRSMLFWQGTCAVHEQFSERRIFEIKRQHPDALLIAHPECEEAILRQADFIGSTSALLKFATESPAHAFIVATEAGILHQMQRARPDGLFLAAPPQNQCACNECPYMKLNTLEKLALCMERRSPEITVPDEVRQRALRPIERMFALSSKERISIDDVLHDVALPFS